MIQAKAMVMASREARNLARITPLFPRRLDKIRESVLEAVSRVKTGDSSTMITKPSSRGA